MSACTCYECKIKERKRIEFDAQMHAFMLNGLSKGSGTITFELPPRFKREIRKPIKAALPPVPL